MEKKEYIQNNKILNKNICNCSKNCLNSKCINKTINEIIIHKNYNNNKNNANSNNIPIQKKTLFNNIKNKVYKYFNNSYKDIINNDKNNENDKNKDNKKDKIIENIKNVVIVTSKIYVSNNKFSYVKNRSIYSSKERFEQTLKTIESIKKYIPNYYIILLDNSILQEDEKEKLKKNTDVFINLLDNTKLNYYTNDCIYKAYGELYQTKIIIEKLKELIELNRIKINHFFKISGRYIINNSFNYEKYNNNKNIFKKNAKVYNRKYYYTCFYKISNTFLQKYFDIIFNLSLEIEKSNKYNNLDYEVFLPATIKDFILINNLGITQNIAVWKCHEDI